MLARIALTSPSFMRLLHNTQIETLLFDAGIKPALLPSTVDGNQVLSVAHSAVIEAANIMLAKTGFSSYRISSIMRSTRIILDAPIKAKPTIEYLELMESFRNKQDARDYANMTREFRKDHFTVFTDLQDLRQIRTLFYSIINVVLSMAAVFAAVFYMADSAALDMSWRVLLALFGAFVAGFAEAWFFAKDWLF